MLINLNERTIIYILNCLNIVLKRLYNKQIIEEYFNIDNYFDDYENIKLIHRIISLEANKKIYNIENEIFFEGQKNYLMSKEKDFKFLKNNKKILTNQKR